MGWLTGLWANMLRSWRLQSNEVGAEWLGQQLRRLFPETPSLPGDEDVLQILIELDRWGLELTPENYLGRLREMVETWRRRFATEAEVQLAARCLGDDAWVEAVVELVKKNNAGDSRAGFGLLALQGAFKKAGLITGPVLHDEVKFVVKRLR